MTTRPIFALATWSAEQRSNGWFYGRTNSDERKEFRGPYKSATSVSLVIAREMTREIARRQQRMR